MGSVTGSQLATELLESIRAVDACVELEDLAGFSPRLLEQRCSLSVLVVLHGDVELLPPQDDAAHLLAAGDLLVLQDDARIRCAADAPQGTTLLRGAFDTTGRIGRRLLESLPRSLVLPGAARDSPVLTLLRREVDADAPGRQAVLDRLMDVLLIDALRCWFESSPEQSPPWLLASGDDVVGPALRALHESPAAAWSVDSLARVAGVSRASFARRFAAMLGEPPISYLTAWRLCLAADLLAQTDRGVDAIARQVGYSGAFALSHAFAREYGIRPGAYREQAALGAYGSAGGSASDAARQPRAELITASASAPRS